MEKMRNFFKQRWKYYLLGYIIGYILPIAIDETIDIYHLMPFKLFSLLIGVIMGTAFYYGHMKVALFEGAFRFIKYSIIIIIVLVLSVVLQDYLMTKGIDISIFVGLPKKG
ncbi:hypothetical protein Cpap_0082 [Ruminiclostridium papyrosolvens DSM 2782]|uniref:Uncharacterized protein n=1 Tax=Ruminiclostridium papyrosolvens DSM 2782 TaxID=588581 RepID=F1TIQ1_9FIRM|nr:hypothetical protein [Ruminiclostridium papyrosolvens]EGD45689.1 hypothetical protein Cpap_0082 [Ruminiclostridium papyrosolvens DSM 2782]WES32937.1 hypothetical protein P0092_14355 [Ruminiclostridium papyrosolvens DSM 2782]